MLIDCSSISKRGPFIFYNVAPGVQHQNGGSFVICSVANGMVEHQSGITGEINISPITLTAEGRSLPYRLRIGKKSINQLKLWQFGYHIPHTVVLDFSLFEVFKREGRIDLQEIYDQVIAHWTDTSVAIRCSSNLEDGEMRSFAGTFDTYLDVPNQLNEIQRKIFQSFEKFGKKIGRREEVLQYDVQLSIMIQQMIQPKISGILFTLDPMNPPSDWLKIEYWQGPRDKSEEISLTLNRETGKQVSSSRDDTRTLLPMNIQNKLYHGAIELERNFGVPQDIEFLISADDALFLVQSRPITAFSYTPDKVRVVEQQKLSAILDENERIYQLEPVLSSTNIAELFTRAIPLGYSIFKYGFAGTAELEGGISIGRSKLGYARLDSNDGANLFYTVADQARTNLIVDALSFRLPGISKNEYLNVFVKHYFQQIKLDSKMANYPEDGLYLQTDDPSRWLAIAGARGEYFRAKFSKFLDRLIHFHTPREYRNANKFFQRNNRRYHSYLDRHLHRTSPDELRKEINDILSYLRTTFCPQYVVYARLAFLYTHITKVRLNERLEPQSRFTPQQILNELLLKVTVPTELEEPQYHEFERLFKLGRVTLPEFLYRFQYLGPLDIAQPRLGDYLQDELIKVLGHSTTYGIDDEHPDTSDTDHNINTDIAELGLDNDPTFRLLYTYAGQFMRLREKAKSELMKLLWVLKRRFAEFARPHQLGDLIYYLELDEALTLGLEKRDELRMLALQRKAYFDACRQIRVKDVLINLQHTPFEKMSPLNDKDGGNRPIFAWGKTILHGHAEGFCLTASSNEEFIEKLAAFRAKNIESIIGVFKGMDISYFNVSALAGFVTESSSDLSHAATIAREFRLPCITGIGFGQFRDEDYLILDTENEQVIIRR